MEILSILAQNREQFQEVLPHYQSRYPSLLWGCVEKNTVVGTVGLEVTEDGCGLCWLWVAPDARGHGYGSALLDTACRTAMEKAAGRLTVSYPQEEPWAAVLDYMLAIRGFRVLAYRYPTYRITREQLLSSPLLAEGEQKADPRVVPLSSVERFRLQELLVQCKLEREYLVSHAAFGWMDGERSMALVKGGHVLGLTLVRAGEQPDRPFLDLLYLRTPDAREGILLLRQTALALLRHPAGLRDVSFTCVQQIGVRMCRRLLGEQTPEWETFCQGTLYAGLYRPGRDRHV